MAARKTTRKTAKKTLKTAKKPTRATARKAKKPSEDLYDVTANAMGTLTPYLALHDAKSAIEWYGKVFGAKLFGGEPMPGPGGKIMHAQLKVGSSLFFVSDIFPESDMVDASRAGASVNLNIFHKDADKMWERAVANGAKVTMPFSDQFWGDKYGRIIDPFGHSWAITRRSKLSKKQLEDLRVKAMAQMGA